MKNNIILLALALEKCIYIGLRALIWGLGGLTLWILIVAWCIR